MAEIHHPRRIRAETALVRTETLLSSAELAARFDVPERLVVHWARTGRIATYQQYGGRRVYLPSEVRRLLSGPRC